MKKLTLLITLIVLGACSPKKSSVKANVSTTSATIAGVSTGQCAGTTSSAIGNIYDNTSNSFNFENQVKGLLSATISYNDVGSVSSMPNATTGVRFNGVIKLDANGNVVPAQTRILISVYDSIWMMNKITNPSEIEIQLSFDSTKGATISGQFNTQSGDGFLSLKDQYGEVRFEGKIDAQSFSGNLKYQNTVNVDGGTPASGTVGQFYVSRCGILQ